MNKTRAAEHIRSVAAADAANGKVPKTSVERLRRIMDFWHGNDPNAEDAVSALGVTEAARVYERAQSKARR